MGWLRLKIVGGMVAAMFGFAVPAYACICCPWTVVEDANGCTADAPTSTTSDCSYYALTGGNIAAHGAWQVVVQRGGYRTSYHGVAGSPMTVLRGVIQPADYVKVSAWTGAASAGPLAEQECPTI